jgi:hypothetical protein
MLLQSIILKNGDHSTDIETKNKGKDHNDIHPFIYLSKNIL